MQLQHAMEKLTDKDLARGARKIDTSKEFPLNVEGQKFVVLKMAHRKRKPMATEAAFKVLGLFGSQENALEFAQSKLEANDSEDVVVVPTHKATCISEAMCSCEEEKAKILIALELEKDYHKGQEELIKKRVEYTQTISSKRLGEVGVEEHKENAPPVVAPELTAVGAPEARPVFNPLKSKAVVIAYAAKESAEPVLHVYAAFDEESDAEIYITNTLSPSIALDCEIIGLDEWHFPNQEGCKNSDLNHVKFLDSGLNNLMRIPQRAQQKTKELKSVLREKDVIAPEPDLLEAQRPVLTPGMDQMAGMFKDDDSFNQPLNNWTKESNA